LLSGIVEYDKSLFVTANDLDDEFGRDKQLRKYTKNWLLVDRFALTALTCHPLFRFLMSHRRIKKDVREQHMRYVKYEELETVGVLSVNEAAHVLRIGRTRLYELVKMGEIKTLKFLRPIRISSRWLKSYIDHQYHVDEN
jgi:excisionase family DNA binding protein